MIEVQHRLHPLETHGNVTIANDDSMEEDRGYDSSEDIVQDEGGLLDGKVGVQFSICHYIYIYINVCVCVHFCFERSRNVVHHTNQSRVSFCLDMAQLGCLFLHGIAMGVSKYRDSFEWMIRR